MDEILFQFNESFLNGQEVNATVSNCVELTFVEGVGREASGMDSRPFLARLD